jgi:transposase
MFNSQTNNLRKDKLVLADYFINPPSQRQKQYEVVRAIVLENQPANTVSKKFGYKISTIYSLVRDFKAGKIDLFPHVPKGPRQRRISLDLQSKIVTYREEGLSVPDTYCRLVNDKINISERTVGRILEDAGFPKLKRRTHKKRGKTIKNEIIPERSEHLDFSTLKPFDVDCPVAGVFFFIPYILKSGILNILKKCKLPESSNIGFLQACLSMLFLKLVGGDRLSHMGKYDQEQGLGVFAGLNVLPKPTYMSTYSCRCSEGDVLDLQKEIVTVFKEKYSEFYNGDFINLDFHSIPHYGDESEMEKVWCGARGKAMKGANTFFAQNSESNAIIYSRADILRSEEVHEIKKFVTHWKSIKGDVNETLVFDSKVTTYKILDELEGDNIKFITLRKRHSSLIKKTLELPKNEWKKVHISIPKRKYTSVSVHENEIKLRGCKHTFRQIIIKDHGRNKPIFILTNDKELPLKDILEVYAKRWHVENTLAELVGFFNLNALSSPIMIRIHFDILWTIIANTLYHLFAQDLRRFEKALAPTVFRNFIDMPGRVIYDGEKFLIKIRKRAHTPILKEVEHLQKPFQIPWLDGKTVEIIWTP